jgi:hypothetical protein
MSHSERHALRLPCIRLLHNAEKKWKGNSREEPNKEHL